MTEPTDWFQIAVNISKDAIRCQVKDIKTRLVVPESTGHFHLPLTTKKYIPHDAPPRD